MRRYALLLALALVGAAQAERYALLVAVDTYPIVKGRQLTGSAYDLRLMRKMLEFFNFQTDQLARADATRGAIVAKMSALARLAKPGDEFVFYFSGRGSIAPPADKPTAKVQMEPTLVPYDGKETITDFDLRMARVEAWAKELSIKGANATIIVDASFQSATRDDVGRPYNPTPRTIARKVTLGGEVREKPYLGPGIYIAAAPSGGSAYEYLVNASKNVWAGAFTDMLVNEIISQVRKGSAPTYAGAMREIQAYFKDKVRQDYMPGLAPYPFTKTLLAEAETYDKPMFGGINPSAIPPPKQAEIKQMDDDRKQKEKKLRIGLSFPAVRSRSSGTTPRDADDMEKERDPQLVSAMTKYVAEHMPYAEVQPPGGPIDLIVSLVKQPSGGIEARIAGDEVDRARNLRFTGASVEALMKGGMADHLERQSLTLRLFKILDDQTPTWDASAGLDSDKPAYKPNDPFKLNFKTSKAALLYIFDRDDADGIVQMTYPAEGAEDNQLAAGSKELEGSVDAGSPAGKMLVRALFVEQSDSISLPAIGSETLAGLLKQLRVLVPAIESGKLKWTTKELSLTIQP